MKEIFTFIYTYIRKLYKCIHVRMALANWHVCSQLQPLFGFWRTEGVKNAANTSRAGHPAIIPDCRFHKLPLYSPYTVATSASTNVTTNTCNERSQTESFNNCKKSICARDLCHDHSTYVNVTRDVRMCVRDWIHFYVPSCRRCLMPIVGPGQLFYSSCLSSRLEPPPFRLPFPPVCFF